MGAQLDMAIPDNKKKPWVARRAARTLSPDKLKECMVVWYNMHKHKTSCMNVQQNVRSGLAVSACAV